MQASTTTQLEAGASGQPRWSAVHALTLCVSTLIASEFMPVSLLTPIAADLHLTQGQAGQAISVSGLFAVLTSLFIASASRGLDRRHLLLALTALMLVSGLVVAFSPNYATLMFGRALVGVVIGGFWSMSAATVMRLLPNDDVPRGLAILSAGNALATTVAAPLGSFLGQYIGWRGAFMCVVPLAAITLVWQFATLPAMPVQVRTSVTAVFKVLRRPRVPQGIIAAALFFMGQFALFTYLRPFLEMVTRVNVSVLSLILLVLGLAGLLGTYLIGFAVRTRLTAALVAMPFIMAVVAAALVGLGSLVAPTAVLLAVWGLVGTAAPVCWWMWLSRTLPDEAEAGGGLMVAVVQMAITCGASLGGLLFDTSGYQATFLVSALILCGSSAMTAWGSRHARPDRVEVSTRAEHPKLSVR